MMGVMMATKSLACCGACAVLGGLVRTGLRPHGPRLDEKAARAKVPRFSDDPEGAAAELRLGTAESLAAARHRELLVAREAVERLAAAYDAALSGDGARAGVQARRALREAEDTAAVAERRWGLALAEVAAAEDGLQAAWAEVGGRLATQVHRELLEPVREAIRETQARLKALGELRGLYHGHVSALGRNRRLLVSVVRPVTLGVPGRDETVTREVQERLPREEAERLVRQGQARYSDAWRCGAEVEHG